MPSLRLKSVVSVGDVLSWKSYSRETLSVVLPKQLEFEVGAEGIAIGFLRSWVDSGVTINVEVPVNSIDQTDPQGLLSAFGIQLAYLATGIRSAFNSQLDLKSEILKRIWGSVRSGGGSFGSGKIRYLIFRDPDYTVPSRLYDIGTDEFPYEDKFLQYLRGIPEEMGVEGGIGSTEDQQRVANFLYEAAKNSHEHGRLLDSNPPLLGVRSVIVERVNYVNSSAAQNFSVHELTEYFKEATGTRKRRVFLAATVVDYGLGIHHSIPGNSPDESGWDKLQRAVFTNASRKTPDADIQRGLGLPLIAECCKNLGALFIVSSAELVAVKNYASLDRYPGSFKHLAISQSTEQSSPLPKLRGTAITVIWPVDDLGQGDLFSE